MLEDHKAEAPSCLDELFSEDLLPFKLCACRMESFAPGQYLVCFHDSRLRSVDISWLQDECFKDVFRGAVLERVRKLDGPFYRNVSDVGTREESR